jgi:hypothetical protein
MLLESRAGSIYFHLRISDQTGFFWLIPWLQGAAEPKPDLPNDPEPGMEAVPTSGVTEVSVHFLTFLHHK